MPECQRLCPVEQRIMELFSHRGAGTDCPEADTVRTKISRILEELSENPRVSSGASLGELITHFADTDIPLSPGNIENYINYLDENVLPHLINTSSPWFIGHMTSALPFFVRLLAELKVGVNQNVVKIETSKALSFIEREALGALHRMIYNRDQTFYHTHIQSNRSTLGIMTSGGTIANLTALWCARNKALGPSGDFKGVEKEGLLSALKYYGHENAVIIGSELMHYSVDKAADLLGIGSQNLIKIPVDYPGGRSHPDPADIEKQVELCHKEKKRVIALIATAGTTNSGVIEPLKEIGAIARRHNIHFHVDAAWGGPILFSRTYGPRLAGIENADSITIDGHKQLYLPMGIGMVFFNDPTLTGVIEKKAAYIIRESSLDLGKRSVEGSRPGGAFFLHAALHLIGAHGYEYLIDQGIDKTRYMANTIQKRPEFELLILPDMNILNYRFIPAPFREKTIAGTLSQEENTRINEINIKLQKQQRKIGASFVSRTLTRTPRYGAQSLVTLRAVIANPCTQLSHINDVLDEQVRIGDTL